VLGSGEAGWSSTGRRPPCQRRRWPLSLTSLGADPIAFRSRWRTGIVTPWSGALAQVCSGPVPKGPPAPRHLGRGLFATAALAVALGWAPSDRAPSARAGPRRREHRGLPQGLFASLLRNWASTRGSASSPSASPSGIVLGIGISIPLVCLGHAIFPLTPCSIMPPAAPWMSSGGERVCLRPHVVTAWGGPFAGMLPWGSIRWRVGKAFERNRGSRRPGQVEGVIRRRRSRLHVIAFGWRLKSRPIISPTSCCGSNRIFARRLIGMWARRHRVLPVDTIRSFNDSEAATVILLIVSCHGGDVFSSRLRRAAI